MKQFEFVASARRIEIDRESLGPGEEGRGARIQIVRIPGTLDSNSGAAELLSTVESEERQTVRRRHSSAASSIEGKKWRFNLASFV